MGAASPQWIVGGRGGGPRKLCAWRMRVRRHFAPRQVKVDVHKLPGGLIPRRPANHSAGTGRAALRLPAPRGVPRAGLGRRGPPSP